MFLSRSFRRKLLATTLAAVALVLLYDATVIDSRNMTRTDQADKTRKVAAGARLDFVATAYCRGQTTASGVDVQAGIAAADEALLPEGSVISVSGVPEQYRGIYTVMDTGPKVLGRHVDLYMWNCDEAVDFGRRDILLTVLRLGWSPKNTAPAIKTP
jgi:3D (Asp-Asp-Asp) domain-containing protein